MSRIRAVLIGLLAIVAVGLASATASADRISPGGAITATFANVGDISLTVGANISNCPLRLIGNINTTKTRLANGDVSIGTITSANPNPIAPSACSANQVTLVFPAGGWLIAATSLTSGGGINISVRGVQADVLVGGAINCSFIGNVNASVGAASGGVSTLTGLSGSLSGACGTAVVGGRGGTLTPGQTLIV